MALPTPQVDVTLDPAPIADAIAASIQTVMQPLIGSMQSMTDKFEQVAEELVTPDEGDGEKLGVAGVLNQQLEVMQMQYEKLDGIFNFTKGADTKLHSIMYDALTNRKNQETLEEIRDAVRDEMDALGAKLEQSDASREEDAEEQSDADEEAREFDRETADNTREIADAAGEASEGMPDMPPPADAGDKPEKGAKQKAPKGDGILGGIFKEIKGFLKVIGKIGLMIGLLAAAVFGAGDGVFVKIKELFNRMVEVLAPVLETLMTKVVPPLLDVLMVVMDAFMQIVEALMPIVIQIIETLLPPVIDLFMTIVDVFMRLVEVLLPPIMQIVDAALPVVTQLVELLASVLMTLVDALMPVLEPLIGFIADTVVVVIELIGAVIGGVLKFFSDPLGYIQDGLSYLADGGDMILSGLGGFINGLIEFIAGLVEKIPFVGDSAAAGLRSLKVSFGDAAEERMEQRATERAERAADRVVDEIDMSAPPDEFKAAIEQRVADGDMTPEVAGILQQQYEEQSGDQGTAPTPSTPTSTNDATGVQTADVPDIGTIDADKMINVTMPEGLGPVSGQQIMVTKSPDSEGNIYAYTPDGKPIGKVEAASDLGKVISQLSAEESINQQVAAESSIDASALPVDTEQLPTGSAVIDTATAETEEAQSLAMSGGGSMNTNMAMTSVDQSQRVVNQNSTTGIIYTGGQSSLGGRSGPGIPG